MGQNTAGWPELALDRVWPLYCSCVPVNVSWVAPAMLAWSHTTTRPLLQVALAPTLALGCRLPAKRPSRGGGLLPAGIAFIFLSWAVEALLGLGVLALPPLPWGVAMSTTLQ